jgi:MSHA biogenesis protein MshO
MRGFSLVELVTVMAILGILSVGTVFYLRDASNGYISTVERDELVSSARFALDRIATDVRNALPQSVRTTGACLEFVPVAAATHYLDLPTAAAAVALRAVPVDPPQALDGTRAAVPVGGNLYDLTLPAPVSAPVALAGPGVGNEITVNFGAPHRFVGESPTDRFYFVTSPVSVCVDGTGLWRYSNYGFNPVQPTPAALPGGLPGRALLAEDVATGATPFTVIPPTLQRNAVVEVVLPLARSGTTFTLESRLQVRNVP